jgi:hypothetical protein
LQARGLWGQFLRYTNHINEQVATLFLERLDQLRDAEEYAQYFPYQVISQERRLVCFTIFTGYRRVSVTC